MTADHYGTAVRRVDLALAMGGRTRRLSVSRPVFVVALAMVAAATVWSVAATLYLACHDDLFATVLAREVAAQEEYEARIATLDADLQRETSRHLVLQNEVETQVKALGERQAIIEQRASVLKAMADRIGSADDGRAASPPPVRPPANETFRLRLGEPAPVEGGSRRSEASPVDVGAELAALASGLDRADAQQVAALGNLRRPAATGAGRLRVALGLAGLSATQIAADAPRAAAGRAGAGGPFIPLPGDMAGSPFWTAAARAEDDIADFARLRRLTAAVPMRQPLPGPLDVTSEFGPRLDPFLGRAALHTGIDLRGDTGAPVRATATGTVTIADRDGGYGNLVEIDHGNGFATRYAHLSTISVAPHQHVEAGQEIGHVGATGRATGPHLHYETRISGEPVDPARFLKAGRTLSAPDTAEVAVLEK